MSKIANQYKNLLSKEIGSKIGCFAAFYHHCLAIMSAHMHVYCYPLFENSSNNWYTAGYGKLIVWCIIACGDLINGVDLKIDLAQNIYDCEYYLIGSLCENYASLLSSTLLY